MNKPHHSKKISIATLNTVGINNNTKYLNSLILNHDIVCVQETWATRKSQIDQNILTPNMNIFFKPAKKIHKKGRPSGGLAFIVNKDIRCKVNYLSDRVGKLSIDGLIILNVYLPFFNNSNENNQDFDQELEIITDVIENNNKNEILIIGDMNTDIIKINHNTKMLLELIKTNGLTIADIMQQQTIDFTYRKITQNKCLSSWIDHVLCKRENLKNLRTNILDDIENIRDHKAISTQLTFHCETNNGNFKNTKRIKKINLNWLNSDHRLRYQNALELKISPIMDSIKELATISDKKKLKLKVTEILNLLSLAMIKSVEKVRNEISEMAKLKQHYEELFTTRNKADTFGDAINQQTVKEFEYSHMNKIFDFKIDLVRLVEIIKKLPNNKSVGINDISYEMLKYSNNTKLHLLIKTVFEIYALYVMPILLYGMETIELTKKKINIINQIENNLMRSMYFIPKRCRVSNLKLINNLMGMPNKLKLVQIEFFERLIANEFTKQLIIMQLGEESQTDYISDIFKILDELDYPREFDIASKCKYYKWFIEMEHKTNK
ncbi:unnamed protein product, partial [Brachionus calyciflorus]